MDSDKAKSNEVVLKFQQSLRKYLRRYDPYKFAYFSSIVLRKSLHDKNVFLKYPPHFILQAIQANCFFYDKHFQSDFDEIKFDKVIRLYKSYDEPYQRFELEKGNFEGLTNFYISLAHSQYPIQRRIKFDLWSRALLLFADSENLKNIREKFEKKFEISINDWLSLSFSIYSWFVGNSVVVLTKSNLTDSELEYIPKNKVEKYLDLISLTQAEIASLYEQQSDEIPPFLWIFMKSVFLDYPLIIIGDEYLNPHPNLLSYLVQERLYDMFSTVSPDFVTIFGRIFEKYINFLLHDLENVEILKEKQIKSKYKFQGQVCDFLLEFPDSILLVEAKAVQYTKRILNLENIRESNSSRKVAKSFDQIINVARNIKDQTNKDIYGVCITYGRLLFSNFESYFYSALLPNMNKNDDEARKYLSVIPQIFSVGEFEKFLTLLHYQNKTPKKLFSEYFQELEENGMDWNYFLFFRYSKIVDSYETVLSKRYKKYFEDLQMKFPEK